MIASLKWGMRFTHPACLVIPCSGLRSLSFLLEAFWSHASLCRQCYSVPPTMVVLGPCLPSHSATFDPRGSRIRAEKMVFLDTELAALPGGWPSPGRSGHCRGISPALRPVICNVFSESSRTLWKVFNISWEQTSSSWKE